MRSHTICLVLAVAAAFAAASAFADTKSVDTPPKATATVTTGAGSGSISIHANGTDVRQVLHDLFLQVKQNYVIETAVRTPIYLSLDNVDFDEALAIVCHLAKLKADKQDAIFYVTTDVPKPKLQKTNSKTDAGNAASSSVVDDPIEPVTIKILQATRVSTRLPKTTLRKAFAALSKQSGIPISMTTSVPDYKLDAFLNQTSLKYALDHITAAAHLKYKIVNKAKIVVYTEEDDSANTIAISPSQG